MKIIIVGGGFGGVRAALNLANKKGFDVTLVSGQTYFEYHAALYRSATGRSPLEVAIPLREFFGYASNVEVVIDNIASLDGQEHTLRGESGSTYRYDSLILALGNVTEYYGIRGLQKYSYGVKTIHQALRLKRHLHAQLISQQAERNYVVVGGGATGVELAAEMVSYLRAIRKKHRVRRQYQVELVEAAGRVTAALPPRFSRAVQRRLDKLGVATHVGTAIKSESAEGIKLPSGDIETRSVVWTAGVTNNPFFARYPGVFTLGKGKRVKVDSHLRAAKDIFVIGDSADTRYSGMAQTALHDANFVTRNLIRANKSKKPQKYQPKKPIYAIPVGRRWAAVLWGKLLITGRLGWMLRRLADLRLYLLFLPTRKALTTWRYGFVDEEACPICQK